MSEVVLNRVPPKTSWWMGALVDCARWSVKCGYGVSVSRFLRYRQATGSASALEQPRRSPLNELAALVGEDFGVGLLDHAHRGSAIVCND